MLGEHVSGLTLTSSLGRSNKSRNDEVTFNLFAASADECPERLPKNIT